MLRRRWKWGGRHTAHRSGGGGMGSSDSEVSRLLFERRELLSVSGIVARTRRPSGTDKQRWRVVVLHMLSTVATRTWNVTVGETGQIFLSNSRLISDVTSMKRGS
jgi:hypothetical protein